ncbi:MAG: hypothetical protein ACREJM_15180, partial [Candidatus Saccharimonadales bacterium]
MEHQLRLTDLVPRRRGALTLLFAAGLAMVAALEALHTCQARVAHLTTDGHVAAFDLDGEGSLAVWFSTATLE